MDSEEVGQKELILMPVCKRADNDSEGGEHWSLVIYHRTNTLPVIYSATYTVFGKIKL